MSSEVPEIHLLDTNELLDLPAPEWLIHGILPEGDYSVLWGPSRQGKSFVALDWAAAIALGRPWQALHATKQAPVVYIAAEGGRGIQKRVQSLMAKHDVSEIPGLYFLIEPLYLRDFGVVEAFLAELEEREMWPGLVIVDTLSRSFGGGEENASADMGHFIDAVTKLASGRLMTVLIIHHSNATGARERGNTALRCGANAMFGCKGVMDDKDRLMGLTLTNDKQKDDAEAEEMFLETRPCLSSLVLEMGQVPEKPAKGQGLRPPVVMRKQDMLSLLAVSEHGMTWSEWRYAAQVPKATFSRRVRQLQADSEVYKEGDRFYVTPSTHDLAAVDAPDDDNDDKKPRSTLVPLSS